MSVFRMREAFKGRSTVQIMQDIFNFMDAHQLRPLIGATYDFENIGAACIALDSGKVNGKIIVSVDA